MDGFEVEQRGLELLHEIDELLLGRKAAEGVAGDAETDGQVGIGGWGLERGGGVGSPGRILRGNFGGNERGGGSERAGAQEGAPSEVAGGVCHRAQW